MQSKITRGIVTITAIFVFSMPIFSQDNSNSRIEDIIKLLVKNEIQDIQKYIESLEDEVAVFKECLANIDKENELFKKNLVSLEAKLKVLEEENHTLKNELDQKAMSYRLVYANDFEKDAEGWSFTERTVAGINNSILGGYKKAANAQFYRDFDLSSYAFSSVRVRLIYYFLDSWDGEKGYIEWQGMRVWEEQSWVKHPSYPHQAQPPFLELPGTSGDFKDRSKVVEFEFPATSTDKKFRLLIGSTLNEGADNESFGIDNVEIWVR